MPRRLLREPHILAHELRTPLSVLAGWYSLVRDGDISAELTPEVWSVAMTACQDAVDRLNLIISQACDEASMRPMDGAAFEQFNERLKRTQVAIGHSQRVLAQIRSRRGGQRRPASSRAAPPR
jgi:signal transduction histidine kinase